MSIFRALSLLLLVSLSVVSAQDSILVELLGSKYDGLVHLLEHADLLETLESEVAASPGGVTIFAPTDYYLMQRVSPEVLTFLKQDENLALLRKTLLNHVIIGKVDATAWSPVKTVMTLAHSQSQLFLDGGELRVEGAVVRELNALEATDGVVHAISGFLLPKDVEDAIAQAAILSTVVMDTQIDRRVALVTSAMAPVSATGADPAVTRILNALTAAGDYTIFLSLLEQYGVISQMNVLAGEGHPLTVFAPTNAAFLKLQNLQATFAQLGPAVLQKFLLYHVVVGAYPYSLLSTIGMATMGGGTIPTAEGSPLQVTTVGSIVYLGPYPPGVLVHTKSVIHTKPAHAFGIDGVLFATNLLPSAPAAAPALGPSLGSGAPGSPGSTSPPTPESTAPPPMKSGSTQIGVSAGILVAALAATFISLLL